MGGESGVVVEGQIETITGAEEKILAAVRRGDVSKVTIELREGKILNIATESDIPPKDVDEKSGAIIVRNVADYESVTITKHAGKLVKTKRSRPMPCSRNDNLISGRKGDRQT